MTVRDLKGFVHEVEVRHYLNLGLSIVVDDMGKPIAAKSYGIFSPPASDNDAEQERYEERVTEWCNEVESDLELLSIAHFNELLIKSTSRKGGPQ